jgi:hypothetical protein
MKQEALEKYHEMNTNLPPNPAQMRVLERVFVFQAITHHTVKAGVSE